MTLLEQQIKQLRGYATQQRDEAKAIRAQADKMRERALSCDAEAIEYDVLASKLETLR